FLKAHDGGQLSLEEVGLVAVVRACEEFLGWGGVKLRVKKTPSIRSGAGRATLHEWKSACFNYLETFSEELSRGQTPASFSGVVAAYIANSVSQLCELCRDFTEVKLSYTILNRVLVKNGGDAQFATTFRLVPTIFSIAGKLKESLDVGLSDAEAAEPGERSLDQPSLVEFYLFALHIVVKSCAETLAELAKLDRFEPEFTKFLYLMLYITGCLVSQRQPKLHTPTSMACIRKILRQLFAFDDLSTLQLYTTFKNLEGLSLLSLVLGSISDQNLERVRTLFRATTPDNGAFCLLEELFAVLGNLSPAVWLTSGLAQLTEVKGNGCYGAQPIDSVVVQSLVMSAFALAHSFGIWETCMIKRLFSTHYLVFLCMCEAWSHVWCYLPAAVQAAQLESIVYLHYCSQPWGQLHLRTRALVLRLAESFTKEMTAVCANKFRAAIAGFEEDPMLLFSLCSVYPLAKFEAAVVKGAVVTLDRNLKTIYTCPKLMLPALIALKEIVRLGGGGASTQEVHRMVLFARHALSKSCASRAHGAEEPKLIVACCEFFSVAPLPSLEPVALEVLGALFQHINTSRSLFIHNSMISVLTRCALLPFQGESQASFVHYSRTILRRFFEDRDWAAHFSVVWHLSHIRGTPAYSDTLTKVIPSDVQVVLARGPGVAPQSNRPYGATFDEFIQVCGFFEAWLSSHPPPISDFPSPSQPPHKPFNPTLPTAISQLARLLDSPTPIDPTTQPQLAKLVSPLAQVQGVWGLLHNLKLWGAKLSRGSYI
ncbi:hypothetical protein L0F63_002741, partial [Massospora cicadina]